MKVHGRLQNTLNAAVTVSIAPRYEIDRGGTHGNSFGSDEYLEIDANESLEITIDAGKPDGVSAGA